MFWLLLSLFLVLASPVKAVSEFKLDQKIDYSIDESGTANVTHHLELTNNFSQVYATNYQIKLSSTQLSQVTASDSSGNILANTAVNPNETIIDLKFNQPALGKGKTTSFTLNYKINKLAVSKGNTWEVSLPENNNLSPQDSVDINLDLPSSFGNISFQSLPVSQITHFNNRTQVKLNPKGNGQKILLIFGTFQIFDFDLDYYISNPDNETASYDLAVPPDTETQFINFQQFNPPFNKIFSDPDGNWLIRYELNPHQSLQVKVTGQAKITSSNPLFTPLPPPRDQLTLEDVYWPISNPTIKLISNSLSTPKDIYNYVVSNLSYDYNAINSAKRKGALEALSFPSSSLCTEFTDLFVTLARSKGIPAREIEGFAYTNNPKIKPVNINTDILHAWPQFYDKTKNTWVSIDPTWAKTTNGIDYFSDLDLNHLTFVIHGQNSRQPLPPGSYKDNKKVKTVNVQFSTSEFSPTFVPPNLIIKQNGLFTDPNLEISNPNTHSLSSIVISSNQLNWISSPINLLPLETQHISIPKISLIKAALPSYSKIKFSVSSTANLPINTDISEKYPLHYLGVLMVIACSIFVLSVGGIILTTILSKKKT